MPSRFSPRHWGQSSKARFEATADRDRMTVTATSGFISQLQSRRRSVASLHNPHVYQLYTCEWCLPVYGRLLDRIDNRQSVDYTAEYRVLPIE